MSWRTYHLEPGVRVWMGSEGETLDEGEWREWIVQLCEPVDPTKTADYTDYRLVMCAKLDPSIVVDRVVSGGLAICRTDDTEAGWPPLPNDHPLVRVLREGPSLPGTELKVEDLTATMRALTFGPGHVELHR